MKIYRYSASGLYIGEAEAKEPFLEEGKYLTPANATPIPPPACGDGECAVFREGSWEIQRIEADSFLEMDGIFEISDQDEEKRIARENLSIIVEMIEIETLEQHRAIRDFALTGNRSRLEQIEGRIAELRKQLI